MPETEKFFESETMSSGEGTPVPPAGTVNLLCPKFIKKKFFTSYSSVKTPNLQKIFESETMSSSGGGGGAPAGTVNLLSSKFFKKKFYI